MAKAQRRSSAPAAVKRVDDHRACPRSPCRRCPTIPVDSAMVPDEHERHDRPAASAASAGVGAATAGAARGGGGLDRVRDALNGHRHRARRHVLRPEADSQGHQPINMTNEAYTAPRSSSSCSGRLQRPEPRLRRYYRAPQLGVRRHASSRPDIPGGTRAERPSGSRKKRSNRNHVGRALQGHGGRAGDRGVPFHFVGPGRRCAWRSASKAGWSWTPAGASTRENGSAGAGPVFRSRTEDRNDSPCTGP